MCAASSTDGGRSPQLPPSQPESVDASGGDFSDALLFGGSGSLGEGVSAQVLEAVQCSVSPVHSPGRDRNGSVGSVGSEPGVASGSPLDTVPPFSPATLRRVSLARIASSDSVDIPTTPHDEDRRVLRRTLVGPSSLPPPSLRPALGDADTGTPQLARESAEALLVDTPEAAASGPPAAADGQDGTAGAAEARDGGSVSSPSAPRMAPDDFEILSLVGQGAFGKVFQVQQRTTGRIYAMKVMKKAAILEKNQAEYMRTERDVLTRVDHPFVVTLRFSFQTVGKLYLVLDFINGGHLFFQLYRHGIFEEALARTYTAELVLALAHLHSLGIAHRDLKPENILLDAAGHIRVTDFGLAKLVAPGARFNSLVGTVEYMAPEIVAGRGHGMAADWWSVGILLFEMLTGQPPFRSKNRGALQKKILTDKIKYPTFLSAPAHKLLSALLQREEAKRLGSGADGAAAIQRHDFFKGVNWRKLLAREVDAPFRPAVADERCTGAPRRRRCARERVGSHSSRRPRRRRRGGTLPCVRRSQL